MGKIQGDKTKTLNHRSRRGIKPLRGGITLRQSCLYSSRTRTYSRAYKYTYYPYIYKYI